MSRRSSHCLFVDFAGQEIFLGIDFQWSPGHRGVQPSLSDPGEPPEGPEIYITNIEWARVKRVDGVKSPSGPWTPIQGPMFDLLADDPWIIEELISSVEDESYD